MADNKKDMPSTKKEETISDIVKDEAPSEENKVVMSREQYEQMLANQDALASQMKEMQSQMSSFSKSPESGEQKDGDRRHRVKVRFVEHNGENKMLLGVLGSRTVLSKEPGQAGSTVVILKVSVKGEKAKEAEVIEVPALDIVASENYKWARIIETKQDETRDPKIVLGKVYRTEYDYDNYKATLTDTLTDNVVIEPYFVVTVEIEDPDDKRVITLPQSALN